MELEHAVEVSFGPGRLRVARAEDTVAYKPLFDSEQEVKNARSIVVRQAALLDWARLEAIAARLGEAHKLRAPREEIERDSPPK